MIVSMQEPLPSGVYYTHPDEAAAWLSAQWQKAQRELQQEMGMGREGLLRAEARFYFGMAQELIEWREGRAH